MGISIYYEFSVKKDLKSIGYLDEIENQWSAIFNGEPYEPWSWYDVEKNEELFFYQGATGLSMDEFCGPASFLKALELLSKIRNEIGGERWHINLDDMVIPWDEETQSYAIEM